MEGLAGLGINHNKNIIYISMMARLILQALRRFFYGMC